MTTDQILAGYLVTTRATNRDWQDVGLTGPDQVSMSECIVDLAPVDKDGWDHWFLDLASARQARTGADQIVLAVGLAADDIEPLLPEMADCTWDAHRLAEQLTGQVTPPETGTSLGFEPVGFDSGLWHTWTCLGGLVNDVRQATGVRAAQWGLIRDEEEARRAAEWLTASGLGDPKVFLWVPAQLTDVS